MPEGKLPSMEKLPLNRLEGSLRVFGNFFGKTTVFGP